jgi:hypothetical protein
MKLAISKATIVKIVKVIIILAIGFILGKISHDLVSKKVIKEEISAAKEVAKPIEKKADIKKVDVKKVESKKK